MVKSLMLSSSVRFFQPSNPWWLMLGGFYPFFHVGKTIMIHPPNYHFYRWYGYPYGYHSQSWLVYDMVLPTENPGTGDFHRNLHSLRSCLPADKRWCKHARHLGGPNRTIFQWGNGCSKARDFGSFLHQENLTQNLLGKQFSELWIFRFFFQIFGELHKSFSNFCRFNPNALGKCILQFPATQNLDMCRHNISFLMTNPNFHVSATW